MPNKISITVGKVKHGGQDPSNGVTVIVDPAVQVGDLVTADPAVANRVIRGANGAFPVGVVETIEKDGLGTLQNLSNVQVLTLTGAVILGVAGLQVAGDGTARLVAAAPGTARSVHVLGTQVLQGVTYVALYLL